MKKEYRKWLALAGGALVVVGAVTAAVLITTARLQQELFKKAPEYTPTTLYSRGVDQAAAGDYAAAEQSLELALQTKDDPTYRGELAVVKYRLKKYEESISQYQALISAGKDAAFAWNGIGNVYRDWADATPAQKEAYQAKAIEAYQQSIALNEQYEAAYGNLALLYVLRNESSAAADILAQGIARTRSAALIEMAQRTGQK
jgi:tetratricopeptide (TPR) repeat protein